MQVAGVLSDLASLRACDHADALALVNIHKAEQTHGRSQNQDVQRATELIELHRNMKEHHIYQNGGVDAALQQSRMDVDAVLAKLGRS
ncbi:hypothetical protein TMEN_4429 [Trichophyton mentagrophytes]|nr:hypothetical protein TMEN_4429 [Trichophyton mentagrophytes]